MGAELAIAKLLPTLRRDERSGLCKSEMPPKITRTRNKASNRGRTEAKETKSKVKRSTPSGSNSGFLTTTLLLLMRSPTRGRFFEFAFAISGPAHHVACWSVAY
jgi:hypothetical protein